MRNNFQSNIPGPKCSVARVNTNPGSYGLESTVEPPALWW